MNYLAHLFLSGNDHDLLFGNFIADHVKGNHFPQHSPGVRQGIKLHRMIDAFTDAHQLTDDAKTLLRPHVKKYAPVAVDIIFDHFLAAQWDKFNPDGPDLQHYAENVYALLDERTVEMPERTKQMYIYMRRDNWLVHYSTIEGISITLNNMAKRIIKGESLANSTIVLKEHYDEFDGIFNEYFPQLMHFTAESITGSSA